PKGLAAFLSTLAERNKNSTGKQGLFASHPEMDERLKKLDQTIASQKLTGSVTLEGRFHQNVTYKPVAQASIATLEKGAGGLAGDSGKPGEGAKGADGAKSAEGGDGAKGADSSKGADGDTGKKKKGFGLSKLMGGGGGGEQKSAETTGSAAARGV